MFRKTAAVLAFFTVIGISTAFAAEFSADMIADMGSGAINGKLYFKSNEVNRSEMMGMISIIKHPAVYQVFSDTKKYHVSDVNALEEKNPLAGATDFKSWALQNNMKMVGQESVQGFKCDIYEGDVAFDSEHRDPMHMKFWLSKKLNYPLKNEIMMASPVGKVSTHLENIKIGKQPAHLFEVPAGYEKAATMNEALGIPDMGAFMQGKGKDNGTESLPGEMPSTEQMDEMMKKVQDMMKNMKQN